MPGIPDTINLALHPPHGITYHLISLLVIELGLGIVLAEWRHTRTDANQRALAAFGGLLGLKGVLLVAVLPAHPPPLLESLILPSLERTTDLAALFFLGWAFLSSPAPDSPDDKGRLARAAPWGLPLGLLISLFLFAALTFFASQSLSQTADQSYNQTWPAFVWQSISLLTLLGGGVMLWRGRTPARRLLWAVTGVLAAGHAAQMAFPGGESHYADWVRLAWLVAQPLLVIHVYRRLPGRLDEHSRELARLLHLREEEAAERQAILESIADGVVVADASGRVTMVNAAAKRIFGQPEKQLRGRPVRQLFGFSSDAEGAIPPQDGITDQSSAVKSILELAGKTVQTSLALVKRRDGDVLGYVGVVRDITREMSAQRAKSEFITNVSHELRTPMTSIKGYVELFIEGVAGEVSATQQKFLGIIHRNTQRMVKLLNNLIAVSEFGTDVDLNVQSVNLQALLEDAVAQARPTAAERGLTVGLVMGDGDLSPVAADPARVYQILEYLLSNACHFTQEGGHVEVRAREHVHDGRREVVVAVADTGVGIPPEEQDRIFAPFYQVEGDTTQVDGIGVGLTIARALVQAHGGRLWVESRPGEGSTFYFALPVLKDKR